jgi:hypothetical protein
MDLRKKVGMAKSFASSVVSRGIANKKTDKLTKQLRVISCFGNEHLGGELPPCEHLKNSKTEGKYVCGGCGCGDKKNTWLLSEEEEYSKLDYPKLTCPLKMPGFSNYKEDDSSEETEQITRKYYIEKLDVEDIKQIHVTSLETPQHVVEAMEKREKERENKKAKSE